MSFPWHNPAWREVADFLGPLAADGDRILAPDQFWSVVTRVDRYVPENLEPEAVYDWVVLRLDDMRQIPRPFLEAVAARMTPVLVNRRFVVWRGGPPRQPTDDVRDGLVEFWKRLAQLGAEPADSNTCILDAALGDAPRITRLRAVDDVELRAAMNDLFRRTGYRYPTLRDRRYHEEMRAHIADVVDRHASGRVLDVASGSERFVDIPAGIMLVRSDVAEVGVKLARAAERDVVGTTHLVMDASRIAFPDATFDAAVFSDAIEHVRDAASVLREVARVLRPGGELLVSFANLNSVNQVLTEKLGYPRFPTNHQHFREFTLAEITELLDAAGLEIASTAGVSFYPYWGVPKVDEIVRRITDDDPEFVAMMSELGRRAGAEFAYTGVVVARRP